MAERCEKCNRPTEYRKDRYCPKHSRELLREMEASGYLEPLVVTTVDGKSRLSRHRYLTIHSMGQFDPNLSD